MSVHPLRRRRIIRIGGRIVAIAQWPTWLTTLAALACGLLTVLNQTTFDFPKAWQTTVTVMLGVFSFLGIGPLLGPKFKAALHLPKALATGVGVVLVVLLVIVQQNTGMPDRAIIIGFVNVAGGLGFTPAYIPTL